MDTCPIRRRKRDNRNGQFNKQAPKRREDQQRLRRTESTVLVTAGVQTQDQRHVETEWTDQNVMKTITSDIIHSQDEEGTGHRGKAIFYYE